MDSLLGSSFAPSFLPSASIFGDEDSNVPFDVSYDSYEYMSHQAPVSTDVEDVSLELELDPESRSAESSYELHSHPSLHSHHVGYPHQSIAAASCADQWLQDAESPVSSHFEAACSWDSASSESADAPVHPMPQHHHSTVSRKGKRSASDLVDAPSPKRIKTELPSDLQPTTLLANENLVAAYQQILMLQFQQLQHVHALIANSVATAPHSPSGASSSASSSPPSPVKQEPLSPPSSSFVPSTLFPACFSPSSPVDCPSQTPRADYHPPQRERRVRPKVVPEKGGVQCQGFNRKKNIRCRNAALMEFMGPRPMYCAEHIHLDPMCLYTKCRSTYHTSPDDGKGCREVVLKEFGFCHKHFDQFLTPLSGVEGVAVATECLQRVDDCLGRLTIEAQAAKKVDPDLFQRKHKLIPKFVQMKACLARHLSAVTAPNCDIPAPSPSSTFNHHHQHNLM